MARDQFLDGAIDLHIHCGPDAFIRYGDAEDIARIAKDWGMRGIVVKNHLTQTAQVATLTRKVLSGIEIFGSVALNRPVGGLDARATIFALKMGAKIVWLPTMDSALTHKLASHGHYDRIYVEKYSFGRKYTPISVCVNGMEGGELLEETKDIIEIVKEYDAILATGHIASKEALAVTQFAKSIGLKKVVITHVNGFLEDYTEDLMRELVKNGAYLELSWGVVSPLHDRQDPRVIAAMVEKFGAEHCVLCSDYGQVQNPSPAEGFKAFCHHLYICGISKDKIDKMAKENPAYLLGLS